MEVDASHGEQKYQTSAQLKVLAAWPELRLELWRHTAGTLVWICPAGVYESSLEISTPMAECLHTREAFMTDVIRPLNARMKVGLKPTVRNIYADGSTVVVIFDARAIARDDKPYINTYAWFLGMRGGRIIKASAFFDSIEFNELWTRVRPRAE